MLDRNPYVIGVPLTGDAAFYGRQDIFFFIEDVLEAGKQNVVVLYGQRRIGKTSVLHQGARWLQKRGGFFPVYFDLQGKERLALGEVLENLAQTIAKRLDIERPDAARFDEDGRYFEDRFLQQVLQHLGERRLVLLFDEFDVLGDELASSRVAGETLFPYLQGLIVNQPRIGFVFVVGRRIEELATHFQAIFKQAVYRRVGHLKPEESTALITEPAKGAIAYGDDAVIAIQHLAAGHPYFTQLICFEAFNTAKAKGSRSVTSDVVEDAVNRAVESGHGALNWFWEGLPRPERFILSAIAQASDNSGLASKDSVRQLLEEHRILLSGLELNDAPDRLVDWEMLRRDGPDAYQFVVEIVRRWVIQEHPLSSARRDIDYVSKRAVRLFENARDAHSEGDLPYARDEYRRTLKANPNHSGAQLGLALALYELGELNDSLAEFEKAYAIDEMSARDGLIRVRLARAKKLEEQSLSEKAALEYQHVLRLVPGEETAVGRMAALWEARGELALAGADFGVARDAFREALKYGRGAEFAARIQAILTTAPEHMTVSDDVEHASASYELLLELLPGRDDLKTLAAAFWARRGDQLDAKGDLEDAIGSYTKAVSVCPHESAFVAKLEATTSKLKERQTIGQVFDQALAAHRAGKLDEARAGWKKLIQLDVLSYRGENIAARLSETILRTAAPVTEAPTDVEATPEYNPDEPAVEPSDSLFASSDESAIGSGVSRKIALIAVLAVAALATFLLWPASVVGIRLSNHDPVKVGETFEIVPSLVYSSDWRRGTEAYVSPYSFSWRSSDESVASVTSGTVRAVAPGAAVITAQYGTTEWGSHVIVRNFDIPALKAYVKGVALYAGRTSSAWAAKDRKYATEFDSTITPYIFLEVSLEHHNDQQDRRGEIRYSLYRSNNEQLDSMSPAMDLKRDQTGALLWSFLLRQLEHGKYRVDLMHDTNPLGSIEFTVK